MTWLGIENVENEVENYAKHVNIDCFRFQYIDNKCKKLPMLKFYIKIIQLFRISSIYKVVSTSYIK